jgi:catechol 2,3-dioxygenase-like lactoylglutathione lyase family enzyme
MFDHMGVTVANLEASKAFYEAALAPLGIKLLADLKEWNGAGFGKTRPQFWLAGGTSTEAKPRVHVAFAGSRKEVDAFYGAAIAAGGKDNGVPGVRPHYHEHYYGAFVLDLDGHNIEVVCHDGPISTPPKAATKGKRAKKAPGRSLRTAKTAKKKGAKKATKKKARR